MSNRDPYSDWIRFGVTVARLRAPHLWPKWLHAGPCGDLVSPQKTLRASRITGCESVPRDAALSNGPQERRHHNQRVSGMSRESSAPDA